VNEKLQASPYIQFFSYIISSALQRFELERMVEVPGNVVILEDENELLEKDDDDDDDDEEPPKGREEVHTVHQHTHAHTYAPKQTHVVEKEGKKRLFALCTTSSHMHTHICTKHTCLKRKKKGCERVCFFFLWVND
jgi:hypothetical protein